MDEQASRCLETALSNHLKNGDLVAHGYYQSMDHLLAGDRPSACNKVRHIPVIHPTVERQDDPTDSPRSPLMMAEGQESPADTNLNTHPTVSQEDDVPPGPLPNTYATLGVGSAAHESTEPGAPRSPAACKAAKVHYLITLRKNILKTLTEVRQLRCQYKATLALLEKASFHSALIREVALPPPISKPDLDKMEDLIGQARSACLPPSPPVPDLEVQVDLMKKVFDLVLLIKGTFQKLDLVWACSNCAHERMHEAKILGKRAATLVPARERVLLGQPTQGLKALRDRLDREIVMSEIEPLQKRVKFLLIHATKLLFNFHKAKLIQEQFTLLDPEQSRKTKFPTYLVSDYDLWQIKPLIKRGLDICNMELGKVPNLIRFHKILIEAHQMARMIFYLFDELSDPEEMINAYHVARNVISLLKHAEDPAYLLLPDMDDSLDMDEGPAHSD